MLKKNQLPQYILISLLWSITFPLVKYCRINGASVWPICLYQCMASSCLLFFQCDQKTFKSTFKNNISVLLILTLLRNVAGIAILNFMLLSNSISQVTISLLMIPFITLLLNFCLGNAAPSNRKLIGIFLSAMCVFLIINDAIIIHHDPIKHSFLILAVGLVFGLEAIIIDKTHIQPKLILFWQNCLGSIFLSIMMMVMSVYSHHYDLMLLPNISIYAIIFLVCGLSILANYLYVTLTRLAGPSISTQINVSIVLLGYIYDTLIYQSLPGYYITSAIILGIISSVLITS